MTNGSPTLPIVCQLVHGLPVGGTEVLVDRLVRRLAHRYKFVIACLDESGELGDRLASDGHELFTLGRRPGFDWACVRRLSRELRQRGVQFVHAHQYTPFAYITATRLLGHRPRVLFTEHGRFYPDYASAKRKLFNRVMTGRHDRLVAVGGSVRQALIDNEGLPPERIEVIYNGVPRSPLRLADGERESGRRDMGAAADDFVVLQVARLDTIKDHSTALRALALALRQQPRLRLVLVGDGPERASIDTQIAALGLQGRVTMLGQRNDVPRLLASADVFLLTSVSEGIPVTVIEAMMAELPVVSTAVGGVPEVIDDGESGLLASAGDAEALAAALVRVANDATLAARLATCAANRADVRFSEDRMVAQYTHIYDELLAGKRVERPRPSAPIAEAV